MKVHSGKQGGATGAEDNFLDTAHGSLLLNFDGMIQSGLGDTWRAQVGVRMTLWDKQVPGAWRWGCLAPPGFRCCDMSAVELTPHTWWASSVDNPASLPCLIQPPRPSVVFPPHQDWSDFRQ